MIVNYNMLIEKYFTLSFCFLRLFPLSIDSCIQYSYWYLLLFINRCLYILLVQLFTKIIQITKVLSFLKSEQ